MSTDQQDKSLSQLRKRKVTILREFNRILENRAAQHLDLENAQLPASTPDLYEYLKAFIPDPEKYGVIYYDSFANPALWHGRIIHINDLLKGMGGEISPPEVRNSYVVRDKASVFLASFHEFESGEVVWFFRLLAFLPQFKAHYLRDTHFLKEEHLEGARIDYWDFREDVSSFEKLFARHNDEYLSEDLGGRRIPSLIFPLRNEKKQIIATINLSPPPLISTISARSAVLRQLFYLMSALALLAWLIHLIRLPWKKWSQRPWIPLLIVIILLALRGLMFPLSQIKPLPSLAVYSPASTSFISLGNLTASPADIFLSALILFLVAGTLCVFALGLFHSKKSAYPKAAPWLSFGLSFILIYVCFLGTTELLSRLVLHSSFNLFRISPNPVFFLIHISIFAGFAVLILIAYTGLKIASMLARGRATPFLTFSIVTAGYVLMNLGRLPWHILGLQVLVIILITASVLFPRISRQKEVIFSIFLTSILVIFTSLEHFDSTKKASLLQNSLKKTVTSQEDWGTFLLEHTINEIEEKQEDLIFLLRNRTDSALADEIWNQTLLAKFNWYSALEILDPEGEMLSRFSLNIPELYRPDLSLPLSESWEIIRQTVSHWSKDKDFLVAYRDWMDEGNPLGRTAIYLSVDYETLPFLYSSNPYFDLLRLAAYPSLDQLDLGFAVFDQEGKLIYNPSNVSSGIPAALLENIPPDGDSLLTTFADRNRVYRCLFFDYNSRIYALFLPRKTFLRLSVDFLKLFFLNSAILIIIIGIHYFFRREIKGRGPFWSFSNRVYIAFAAIALIPLLLFTFSTREFFAQLLTQKVTEEAEAQASVAHRVIKEVIFSMQEDQLSLTIPPDNLVLWISSAISNDVNLYLDGKIESSSHREFFDYGLLPELIDGEIFYKIQYENNPFYTRTQRIGSYAFHTLTIPYAIEEIFLLISLPFPLEQQEISKSTVALFEFLFFVSVFFILIVMLFARAAGSMIITPIRKLLSGTREVSLGNLEISIPYQREDEMKTLISGFNTMVKSLKKHQQEMAELSKKVAWTEMARKVAHEIKNPLTPIQLSAEHLQRVYADNPEDFEIALKESTSYIVKEVDNLRKIAQQFLDTSKEALLVREDIDVRELIASTVEPYKKTLAGRITVSDTYSGEDFFIAGDRGKLTIVLRNILTNAIESIWDKGRIDIIVDTRGPEVKIEILDTGVGLSTEVLDRIFEPYFSTKDAGTGLGLPIAKKIIEDHGGTIGAALNQPHGMHLIVTLPKKQTAVSA